MKNFKNLGVIFTVNLDSRVAYDDPRCNKVNVRRSTPVVTEDGPGSKVVDLSLAGSVTWLAGEELCLPDAVASLPQVARRIASGQMRVRAA